MCGNCGVYEYTKDSENFYIPQYQAFTPADRFIMSFIFRKNK